MGRLLTTGAESNAFEVEGVTPFNTPGIVTSPVRTGNYAYSNEGSGQDSIRYTTSGVLGTTYYIRAYFHVDTTISVPIKVLTFRTAAVGNLVSVRIYGISGKNVYGLWNDVTNTQIGSNSLQYDLNTWVQVELSIITNVGSTDAAEMMIENVSVANATGLALSDSAPDIIDVGYFGGSQGKLSWDDVALNDSNGSDQNSWPGAGSQVLLLPISDNARDTKWTGGAGGTTNLYDAVNNTPPIGTATETDLTQIEHAGGAAGTTDRYDANMTTFATTGLTAADTISLMQFVEVDGEDITTGAKLLNFEVLSNPVMASPGNVTAGDNIGALGTYPANWAAHRSAVLYNPSVDVDVSPVMRARRPETASRVASVCFMGIYVEYVPAEDDPAPRTGGLSEFIRIVEIGHSNVKIY